MRTANFIQTQLKTDLIISFAVPMALDPAAVESLTLLRTPKYEVFLEDHEREVRVSFELEEKGNLKEFAFDPGAGVVRLTTDESSFEVDISRVESAEIKDMLKVLTVMNFDERFKVFGI